jgi:hypothetical protein
VVHVARVPGASHPWLCTTAKRLCFPSAKQMFHYGPRICLREPLSHSSFEMRGSVPCLLLSAPPAPRVSSLRLPFPSFYRLPLPAVASASRARTKIKGIPFDVALGFPLASFPPRTIAFLELSPLTNASDSSPALDHRRRHRRRRTLKIRTCV